MIKMNYRKFSGINNIAPQDALISYETGKGTAELTAYLDEGLNIDLDDNGYLRRRKGRGSAAYTGTVHSLFSDERICLFREAALLKRFYPDNTTQTLRTGLDTSLLPMAYLSLNNKIYYSDMADNGVVEDGASRTWGLETPLPPFIERVTGGNLKAGGYLACLTYSRSDGQESGSSDIDYVYAQDNEGFNIILPVSSDPSVNAVNIYLTTRDADTFYLAGQEANGTTEFMYMGDGSDLTLALRTKGLSPVPKGHILEFYNGRIYIARDNIIHYSEPYAFELCNLAKNYIPLESRITMMRRINTGMVVSTEDKTMLLQGNDVPEFRVIGIFQYGAIEGSDCRVDGIVIDDSFIGRSVVWSTNKGICCINEDGSFYKNLTENIYRTPPAYRGAGLYRQENGISQYLVVLEGVGDLLNTYQ